MRGRDWLFCLLVLGAAALALLHPALRPGRGLVPADGIFHLPPWKGLFGLSASNYLLSDQYMTFLPMREHIFASLRQGRVPLWTPLLSCGIPLAGVIQLAPLFPLNWPHLLIKPFYAAVWVALLKIMCAGGFTFLYMSSLGAGRSAAVLSSLAFSLSGFMIVWLGHPHANCAVLLPLMLYFLERGLSETGPRPWAGLGLSYGLMLLGGHPPTMVQLTLLLLAYFLLRAEPAGRRGRAAPLILALAAGAMVAAPALLPYLEYLALSSTSAASSAMQRWAYHLPVSTLIHQFLPLVSGSPARRGEALGAAFGLAHGPYDNFNERTGYVGVLALFLAAAALCFRKKEPAVRLWGWLCLGCAVFIWRLIPPLSDALRFVPILSAINPTRLLLPLCLGLSVLAGLGLDALPGLSPGQRRRLAAGLAIVASAILGALALAMLPIWNGLLGGERAVFLWQLPVFAAAVLLCGLLALKGRARWAAPLAVLGLALELVYYGFGANPALPERLYYPRTPALDLLAQDRGLFRVLGLGWALAPNTGMSHGLADARGQDFTSVRRYEELITGSAGAFFFYTMPRELPPSLPLLGVKYLLAQPGFPAPAGFAPFHDGDMAILRALKDPARALFVPRHEVSSPPAILKRVRDPAFDPRRSVLLEAAPRAGPEGGGGSARLLSHGPNEVFIESQSESGGWVLLLDTWFPGWKATVDGHPAEVHRADYNFRAVAVPPGKAAVRFFYVPLALYAGLALAGLGLCALAAAWR